MQEYLPRRPARTSPLTRSRRTAKVVFARLYVQWTPPKEMNPINERVQIQIL